MPKHTPSVWMPPTSVQPPAVNVQSLASQVMRHKHSQNASRLNWNARIFARSLQHPVRVVVRK